MKITVSFTWNRRRFRKVWQEWTNSPFIRIGKVNEKDATLTLIPPSGFTFSIWPRLQPKEVLPGNRQAVNIRLLSSEGDIGTDVLIEAKFLDISGIPTDMDKDSLFDKLVENRELEEVK